MSLGENLSIADRNTNERADVFAFGMSAFRPYSLHVLNVVLPRPGLLRSVRPLRLKDPTQFDLQAEENMEQRRWEKERGGHCVFS